MVNWFRSIRLIMIGVVLAALWLSFAPAKIGGSATYLRVSGQSMEPKLHRDDLVVIRKAPVYRIGDVVAYQSRSIKSVVLHRIIAREENRYVLQGDNNNFVDAEQAVEEQIIGKMSFKITKGGMMLGLTGWARSLMVIGIAVMGMLILLPVARRRRRGRGEGSKGPTPTQRRRVTEPFAFAGVAVLLAAITLGLVASAKPTRVFKTKPIGVMLQRAFDYHAALPGSIYENDTLVAGEPLFLRLGSTIQFAYSYELATSYPAKITGTIRLATKVTDASGWKRTVDFGEPHTFAGSKASITQTVDVGRAQRVIEAFERQSGVNRDFYTYSIIPVVVITGIVDDAPFANTLSDPLEFTLSDTEMSLKLGADQTADPLNRSQSADVSRKIEVPNHLRLAAWNPSVTTARKAATGIGIVGLILLGAAGLTMVFQRKLSEPERIFARYKSWIIPLRDAAPVNKPRSDVDSIDDLVRIAERYDRVILYAHHDESHDWLVEDGDTVYRFRMSNGAHQPSFEGFEDRQS